MRKPIVLVFCGHYLPGFKAGGILRSIENMVNHLHGEFEFRIVTRDRDLGDEDGYPGIQPCTWTAVGAASVYYLPPGAQTLRHLTELTNSIRHDLIYLNSFFEPLTIKVLACRNLGRIRNCPVLLSPRGEFSWASLRLKYPKKAVFMLVARLGGLYRGVRWHASSGYEAEDIRRVMRVDAENIRVALDLPAVNAESEDEPRCTGRDCPLRIVFLSRISPEKNLDFALKVVARVQSRLEFDIIGPIENKLYWAECQKLLAAVPGNVTTRVLGSIPPTEVMKTLRSYDLLFFPSGGENYGHVIAEALTVGTPALISTRTPWRNLEMRGLGWDLPLENENAFVAVIDTLATRDRAARSKIRIKVRDSMRHHLSDPAIMESNRQLIANTLKPAHPNVCRLK